MIKHIFILIFIGKSAKGIKRPLTSSPVESDSGDALKRKRSLEISPIHRDPTKSRKSQNHTKPEAESGSEFQELRKRCEDRRIGKAFPIHYDSY